MLVAPLAYPFEAAALNVDVLDWLVVVTVTGVFIGFVISGVTLWRLPSVFPNRYEHSFYKLPLPLLKVVVPGTS